MDKLYNVKVFVAGVSIRQIGYKLLFMLLLCTGFNVYAQQPITVTGTIKDSKGEALPGVSIRVKDSQAGTTADANGKYNVRVSANATLVFSFIGFGTQEVVVSSRTVIDVTMGDNATGLNEVVVLGYNQQQKKSSLTAAVSTVSGREILQSPTANTTNSLVGRVTGVTAVQRSGQPGADGAALNVRGQSTYNNSGAIVVVDGIERPNFGDIDPNEIENISILKDAASTAIYGIRGANGVIVVTTKVGRIGKPRINYTGNFSLQGYTGIPKALNAYDNTMLMNEGLRNEGLAPRWTDAELQKFKDGSDPLGYPDVNWFDYLTRKLYPQTQHNVNISGGTNVIRYAVSAGYLAQSGIFKKFDSPFGINSVPDYHRYNFRSNIDINLSKSLTVSVKLGGRLEQRYQPAGLRASSGNFSYDNLEGMISRILQTPSFAYPVMLPDGRIAQNVDVGTNIWNPLAVITRWGTRNDDNNTVESTFNLNWKLDKLTKGLTFTTNFGYDSYYTSNTRRNALWAAYTYDRLTGAITLSSDRPRDEPLSTLISESGGTLRTNIQTGFNYNRSFNKDHNVSALILGTRQLINGEGTTQYTIPPRAAQGVLGRVTYNYKEKYFFEADAGYNGSENFAKGNQYGFFPAVSAGWTLSNENFLKDVSWLDFLKLRGSYGKVGNDQLDQRFLFLTNYAVTANGVQFGQVTAPTNGQVVVLPNGTGTPAINGLGNDMVTWETGIKRNIGFESEFFNHSLKVNVDFFDEKRSDILSERRSGLLAFGHLYPSLNVGKVYNKGYEAEIDYQRKVGQFTIGFNTQVSFARNRIDNADEPVGAPDYQKQEGHRVGQFFGYKTNGFFTSQQDIDNSPKITFTDRSIPGDLKYVDYNGDGLINSDDRVPIGYSRFPEYTYSFTPRVAYKGISLSVLFQGVANVSSDVFLSEQNNGQQMYEFMLDRWTPQTAATATWPAIHSRSSSYPNYQLNDFVLQNASYLKIRNAELSWTLPSAWVKAMKLGNVRVFTNGQNLVTWTKFKMYVDPENVNLSNTSFSKQSLYPSSRVYNFGVNIQF
ncbi:TonB-dependent receptor [Mucilaginibacter galii]|uniref:SusC/RagA family TonB-linked outer membrane protein n=1 Tax=Mucilaginibacter galii TaxID=2005073 RepID=A0A917JA10_9SPHI|nr:TonB-dependent receptor [Mucilaginibacter galii]GGI50730.1 SusC/RagA family TonB-linked outer membrane protein [Mucilaginibacter galii]